MPHRDSHREWTGGAPSTSAQAEKLVHRMERCSCAQADLGLSLFKLSKFEEMEGEALSAHTSSSLALAHMCGALRKAGTSAVRASRVARKATGASAVELAALHEFLAFTPAVIKGLTAREKQLLTHETLQADMEAKKKAVADLEVAGQKVFGGDAAKLRKVTDLRNDVAVLEMSLVASKAEYTKIKGINQQCALHQRSSEVWQQLGAELQADSAPTGMNAAGGSNSQHHM
ncbi:MAG: hypothetical protein WDW38_005326 [Sanguina aurantia]